MSKALQISVILASIAFMVGCGKPNSQGRTRVADAKLIGKSVNTTQFSSADGNCLSVTKFLEFNKDKALVFNTYDLDFVDKFPPGSNSSPDDAPKVATFLVDKNAIPQHAFVNPADVTKSGTIASLLNITAQDGCSTITLGKKQFDIIADVSATAAQLNFDSAAGGLNFVQNIAQPNQRTVQPKQRPLPPNRRAIQPVQPVQQTVKSVTTLKFQNEKTGMLYLYAITPEGGLRVSTFVAAGKIPCSDNEDLVRKQTYIFQPEDVSGKVTISKNLLGLLQNHTDGSPLLKGTTIAQQAFSVTIPATTFDYALTLLSSGNVKDPTCK
jgi:hypothetical protein